MTDQPETTPTSSGANIGALLAIATGVAWLLAVVMTFSEYSTFTDRRDSASSAPQVSQVADEFLVAVAPWLVIAAAVTAVCVVIALARRT